MLSRSILNITITSDLMIHNQTRLIVADNSGAKQIMCISLMNRKGKIATVGDVILGVVKSAIPNMSVKKSDLVKAVVVRTKQPLYRPDGSRICFTDNAAVIVNNNYDPVGTRIFGPVARELRDVQMLKLISLAEEVL